MYLEKFSIFHFTFIIFILICNINNVDGAVKQWNGGSSQSMFTDASKWSPAVAPGVDDDIQIYNSAGVLNKGVDVSIKSLTLASSSQDPLVFSNLTISETNEFKVDQKILVNPKGILTLDDSTIVTTGIDCYGLVRTFNRIDMQNSDITVYPGAQLLLLYEATVSLIYLDSLNLYGSAYAVYTYLQTNNFGMDSSYLYGQLLSLKLNSSPTSSLSIIAGNSTFELESGILEIRKNLEVRDESLIVTSDSKVAFLNTTIDFNQNSMFAFTGNASFVAQDCIFNLNDNSSFFVRGVGNKDTFMAGMSTTNYSIHGTSSLKIQDSIFFMTASKFLMENSSILTLLDSIVIFQRSNAYFYDSSTVNILNGNLTLFANQGFYSYNNSKFYVAGNEGFVFTNGSHYMLDNSSYVVNSSGILFVNGKLSMESTSHLTALNTSQVLITGTFLMKDNGYINLRDSLLRVNGTLSLSDNSSITVTNTFIDCVGIGGNVEVAGSLVSNYSNITVNGILASRGDISLLSSNLTIGGDFSSFGVGVYVKSNITTGGNAAFNKDFSGHETIIRVVDGDMLIHRDAEFNCTDCTITIEKGKLLYDKDSTINLKRTLFSNRGEITSFGNFVIYQGSSISNDGIFKLSADIRKSDDVTETITFYNNGSFSSNSSSRVEVPIANSGSVSAVNSSQIYFADYKQTSGVLSISDNSEISSNNTFIIEKGNVLGNGTIKGSIESSGNLGSIELAIDRLNIIGNLSQTNGTITITIHNFDEFTQLNISEVAILGGNLNIRINEEILTASAKEMKVMNYGSSQGTFSNVQIKTFKPSTGQESSASTCSYDVNKTEKSLSVLVSSCLEDKKLSGGAIAGIVIGCIVVVGVVGVVIHYRSRILIRYKTSQKIISLKSMFSKKS